MPAVEKESDGRKKRNGLSCAECRRYAVRSVADPHSSLSHVVDPLTSDCD